MRGAYLVAVAAHLGLVGLLTASIAWWSPPRQAPVAVALLLGVGPLMLTLRGLLHGRARSHLMTSLLALFYLLWGLVDAIGDGPWSRAGAQVALSLSLIAGTLAYTRAAAQRGAATRDDTPTGN